MQWLRVTVIVKQTLNWIPLFSIAIGTITVGECLRILEPHQFLHLTNSDNKISSLQVFWGVRHNYLLNNTGLNCMYFNLYIVLHFCITLSY